MALTIGWWTMDVTDAPGLAPFYEQLLGWHRLFEDPVEGIALVPPGDLVWGGHGLLLYADHTTGPKRTKNPAHLDLRPADQAASVEQALSLGARPVDIGQGNADWEVLADPEGNELCILAADRTVAEDLVVACWALDVADVDRAARFWGGLLGWEVVDRDNDGVRLQDPDRTAIPLDLFAVPDARQGKNRVHPDLIPSGEEGDRESQRREVERALSLGARRVDIGQGDATWEVLVDTEGNELCVLGPRGYLPEGGSARTSG
ncbi:MAG: VOC family protein [Acidobacteria bacterium]|nr:VOC family protein [Acidobacteriota bacterium]